MTDTFWKNYKCQTELVPSNNKDTISEAYSESRQTSKMKC